MSGTATARDRLQLALTTFAIAASVLVLAAYLDHALTLAAYPWDWSPDEGLALDYGRRLVEAPATLYRKQAAAPFPSAYGPVLPAAMAAVVGTSEPLRWARLLATGWTLGGALAVFALVRRRAGALLALAAAALSLAAFDLTFWYVLVRVDGLMLFLWLAGSAVLAPALVEAGRDYLSPARVAAGAALLLAAVLTKPTAVLHAAPLVLGWWLVDRRSAAALAAALGALGLGALGLLQWASGGAFLWVNRLWALHPAEPGLRAVILWRFAAAAWPLAALCAFFAARRAGRWREWARDPGFLLLAGGLLAVPALAKSGAWWNYLLPALAALAVLAGRLAAPAAGGSPAPGAAAIAAVSLALAATRPFPLPTAEDERTTRDFYDYVAAHVKRAPGPILVSRPDLASYLAHQPLEIEGSSYPSLAAAGAIGTEVVLRRLQAAQYTLVVEAWPLPGFGGYPEAVAAGYARAGGCLLPYYFGTVLVNLRPRRDLFRPVPRNPSARCEPDTAAPPPGPPLITERAPTE